MTRATQGQRRGPLEPRADVRVHRSPPARGSWRVAWCGAMLAAAAVPAEQGAMRGGAGADSANPYIPSRGGPIANGGMSGERFRAGRRVGKGSAVQRRLLHGHATSPASPTSRRLRPLSTRISPGLTTPCPYAQLQIFEPRYRVLFNTILAGEPGCGARKSRAHQLLPWCTARWPLACSHAASGGHVAQQWLCARRVEEGLVQADSPYVGTKKFGKDTQPSRCRSMLLHGHADAAACCIPRMCWPVRSTRVRRSAAAPALFRLAAGMCFVEASGEGPSRMASIGTVLEVTDFLHKQVRLQESARGRTRARLRCLPCVETLRRTRASRRTGASFSRPRVRSASECSAL